jgi:hypothetical protein
MRDVRGVNPFGLLDSSGFSSRNSFSIALFLEKWNPLALATTAATGRFLLLSMQRSNVLHQRVNLILTQRTLKRRHSPLALRNDLRQLGIGEFLDYR